MSGVMATAVASAVRYTVGSTPQTDFAVPFIFDEASDLLVTVGGTATTAFSLVSTITAEGFYTAATVRLNSAAASTDVVISRQTAVEQTVKFATSGQFPVSALNTEIIRLWLAQQDRQRDTENALRVAPGEAAAAELPTRALRAGMWMAFDSAGDPIVVSGSAGGVPTSAMGAQLIAIASAAAGRTLLNAADASAAALTANVVAKAGDTMTGNLAVSKATPVLLLKNAAAGQERKVDGYTTTTLRWSLVLGDTAAEAGSDAGADFALRAYDDAGSLLFTPISVERKTGYVTFSKRLRLSGSTSGWSGLRSPAVGPNIDWITPITDGTARQVMKTDGAAQLSFADAITADTQKTTTGGTTLDFTGIPSGVRRVTVLFNGVSGSGTSNLLVQIGDGSIISTGYTASGSRFINTGVVVTVNSTAGFVVLNANAGNSLIGRLVLDRITGNTWTCSYVMLSSTTETVMGAGSLTLTNALDRVRLTFANGTDTFDAMAANVLYE